MTRNLSTTDRALRVVFALVLGLTAFITGVGSLLGIVMLVVAGVLVVTASVGFCPLYRVLGLSTCPVQKH